MPSDVRGEVQDVWLGPCALDFTRTYLTDQESQAYADIEKQHHLMDLPWSLVVGTAARNKQLESIDEAIRVTLDDEDSRHVADITRISENTDTALRLLSTFPDESMTADVLSGLFEDEGRTVSPEEVVDFFSWADRLGIVCRDGNGQRLDSTYAEVLKRVFWRVSLSRAWVRLPGPVDFLETVLQDLADRISVLAGLPDEMQCASLAVEIADLVKHRRLGRWEAVRSTEARTLVPSDSVARRFDGGNAAGSVLWIDATGGDVAATAWADHARRFAELPDMPRLCIAMDAATGTGWSLRAPCRTRASHPGALHRLGPPDHDDHRRRVGALAHARPRTRDPARALWIAGPPPRRRTLPRPRRPQGRRGVSKRRRKARPSLTTTPFGPETPVLGLRNRPNMPSGLPSRVARGPSAPHLYP